MRELIRHPVARLFVSMVVVQGSLFLSGTRVVRGLGVGLRGEVALVSAFVGIGAQVGLLGLPAAIVYFVSSRGVAAKTVLRRIARWTAVQLVVVSVLASTAGTMRPGSAAATDRGIPGSRSCAR